MLRLAELGIIPKELLYFKDKPAPICVSCTFGTAHKKPSMNKKGRRHTIRSKKDDAPGKCVSMDQLISAQPGLIPQFGGHLTRDRIWAANVAVDHFTNVIKVCLMKTTSQAETLDAKLATEKFFKDHGHNIERWHADNGRYAEVDFKQAVKDLEQSIKYCGVGAHHQNGIAEAAIKRLTLRARTLLLHAKRFWPEAITTMLWPYALLAACDAHNNWSVDKDGKTPMMKLLNLDIFPEMKFEHTFGCPVYVLDSKLQSSGIGPPKWEPCSRLGIYLGKSPFHAGSVALVLNPKTGHVSPQYHLVFDDDFTTIPYLNSNAENSEVPSHWQALCESSTECSTSESFNLEDTWFQKELETQAVKATDSEEIPIKQDEIVAQNVTPDTTMNSNSSSSNPVTNSEGGVSKNIVDTPPCNVFLNKRELKYSSVGYNTCIRGRIKQDF